MVSASGITTTFSHSIKKDSPNSIDLIDSSDLPISGGAIVDSSSSSLQHHHHHHHHHHHAPPHAPSHSLVDKQQQRDSIKTNEVEVHNRELKVQLKKSHESIREMKILLDMFKTCDKDKRYVVIFEL